MYPWAFGANEHFGKMGRVWDKWALWENGTCLGQMENGTCLGQMGMWGLGQMSIWGNGHLGANGHFGTDELWGKWALGANMGTWGK